MELTIKGTFKVETENGFIIHPKVILLLEEVKKTGSLNSAVLNLGMSYSHAWNLLNKTNCKLEKPLITTQRGGVGGGVSKLTQVGQNLLNYCKKLEKDFNDFAGTHNIIL